MSRVFIDTNVLVYRFDASEPAKQAAAQQALASVEHTFIISTQVMLEFYVTVTRKLRPALSHEAAAEQAATLARLPVVSADHHLVERAVTTAGRHQLSVWDAMVLEAAVEADCEEIWTEDLADGATLRGVTVRNPFSA
jgi:predicted nucleic acid-binding protein